MGPETDETFACRLCGSHSGTRMFSAMTWPIARCASCGLVQVWARPTQAVLDEVYASTYFAKGKYRGDEAGRREQVRRHALLTTAGVPAGGRVLDFGMATGEFVQAAEDRYEMWGVEISETAVASAREALPAAAPRLYAGHLEQMNFAPESFDAIVMWDVIEHLDDPLRVLRQLQGLVKPGGAICLSTPDIGALTFKLMQRRWHFMTPPEHLVFFDRRTLAELCRRCQLQPRHTFRKGKWVNLDFLVYKLARVMPVLIPARVRRALSRSTLGRQCLYIPTRDIRYLVAIRLGD